MALLDISLVTSTLMALIDRNINVRLDPAAGVGVTPEPPERVTPSTNRLSLHLYHVTEDPHFRNQPGPGRDVPNVSRAPMALCLYYILTAHHDSGAGSDQDPLTQQKIFGYALKTLHDFPVITDATEVEPGVPILHPNLRGHGNRLEIILRPVPVEEALSFWSAEEQHTARLSAYYEVRVILLEPERPKTFPGTVLALGAYPVQVGAPHLERSMGTVRFTLPARFGGLERAVEVSPARPFLDTGGPPGAPHNRLMLLGNHLTGRRQSVFLMSSRWQRRSPPIDRVEVSADPAWSVEHGGGRVAVLVQGQVMHEGAPLAVLPGHYTAVVRVVSAEKVLLGQLKEIAALSNEIGFAIGPRVASHDPPDAASGRVTVRITPAFDLTSTELDDDAIEVIVDGQAYERVPAFTGAPSDAGRFVVAPDAITFQPLFDVTAPADRPFRLLVNGAESQPFWIEFP